MTYEVTDHRSVLLLNPGLVVLAVRPGTGELDAPLGAVLGESIVDEYTVVVRVDAFPVASLRTVTKNQGGNAAGRFFSPQTMSGISCCKRLCCQRTC